MANSNVPMFIQTINPGFQQILPADTTTLKTVLTGGANGSRVSGITITSTDTVTRDVQLWVTRSATNYLIGTVNLPINAGNINSATSVAALSSGQILGLPVDSNGNSYIDLKSGDVLAVAALTTVTAAKVISVSAISGDF